MGWAAPWVPALLSTSRSNFCSLGKSPPSGRDFLLPRCGHPGPDSGNPKRAQRRGPLWERRSKGAGEGWPTGRPEQSVLCDDDGARRQARTSVLSSGQNLGAGGIHFRRACKMGRVPAEAELLWDRPRRVPAAAAAGIKSKPVISGDMCLGNDTSHGGRGDFFARKRTPSAMWPFSKKRQSRFFDTLNPRHPAGIFFCRGAATWKRACPIQTAMIEYGGKKGMLCC